MQIQEFAKKEGLFKKSFAAIVSIAPEGEEHYLSEISQAGGTLVEWKKRRGASAKNIIITIVCDDTFADDARHILSSIFENTPQMAALANGTDISVSIMNDQETVFAEFKV
ncbi:MAG: hypothetical protein KGZ65_13115 [Sphingomonadales bacterium]|nr:hypothetical protein [Sphingomonadaceae bacterium]MBS3932165.1 hypothetical protein [Sphingomonadales bacterium]